MTLWSGRGAVQRPAPRRFFCRACMIIACVGEFALCHPVIAQNIPTYFPSGTAGYDQQLGVTVLSRLRPLYEEPGIPIDSFVVRSSLDEALRYDSNVDGTPHSGSWASTTSGSLSVGSDWLRNGISAELGFTHNQYFSFPGQSYTDWHAGLGGGYTIADSSINIAYLHQDSHTLGTTIGSISSQTPTLDQADSAQINYTVNLGSLSVTPDISVAAYRFGTSTVLGQPVSEAFLDRDVIAAGFVGRTRGGLDLHKSPKRSAQQQFQQRHPADWPGLPSERDLAISSPRRR